MKIITLSIIVSAAVSAPAGADIITQWNFNGTPGTSVPSIGFGTPTLVGGTTATFASGNTNGGSTDPELSTSDQAWNVSTWATQGQESGLRGVQFAVSTVGFSSVSVSWDQRHSNTSSKFLQFQYALDGVSFSSAGLAGDGLFSADLGGDTWYNGRSVDLSGIAGAANNANFAFRVVAVFSPANVYAPSTETSAYGTSGTWRFDMVTVNGVVPAPGAIALLGLSGIVAGRRRRA